MPDYVLKAAFTGVGILLLIKLISLFFGTKKTVPRLFASAAMGLCLLLLGNTVGELFGAGLGLNAVTVPVAAGLGPAGVALLWALRYLI